MKSFREFVQQRDQEQEQDPQGPMFKASYGAMGNHMNRFDRARDTMMQRNPSFFQNRTRMRGAFEKSVNPFLDMGKSAAQIRNTGNVMRNALGQLQRRAIDNLNPS